MKQRSNFQKAIKFSIVGLSNTLISYLVFLILFKYFNIVYLLSSVFAYFAGLLNGYFWNLSWTFKEKHSNKILLKFLVVNIISILSKLLLIYFMVENLDYNEFIAELVAMSSVIALNFLGNNFWTFR